MPSETSPPEMAWYEPCAFANAFSRSGTQHAPPLLSFANANVVAMVASGADLVGSMIEGALALDEVPAVTLDFCLLFLFCLSTTGKKSSMTTQTHLPATKRFRASLPEDDDLSPQGLDDEGTAEDDDDEEETDGEKVGAKTRLIKSSRSATTAIALRNQQSPTLP